MLLMAGFTIAYEYRRPRWSMIAVIAVLIGIFGVVLIPEQDPVHYIFAATVFFAMIGFMIGHAYYGAYNAGVTDTLRVFLYAQLLFMIVTVIGVIQDAPIFEVEVLFILNFAVYYLYIHFTQTSSRLRGVLSFLDTAPSSANADDAALDVNGIRSSSISRT